MRLPNGLVIFLIYANVLIYGCTEQQPGLDLAKTTENCLVSGQEIQDACNVELRSIQLEVTDAGYCNYVEAEGRYEYTFRLSTISFEDAKANLSQKGIQYEELEFKDGAMYYTQPWGNGTMFILVFENQNTTYMTRAYTASGEQDAVHCASKEMLIELAQKYVS